MKEPIRVEGHKKFGSWGSYLFFLNFDLSAKQQFWKMLYYIHFFLYFVVFLPIIVDDFFIRKETIMMEKQD